jgi:hypothetical protein
VYNFFSFTPRDKTFPGKRLNGAARASEVLNSLFELGAHFALTLYVACKRFRSSARLFEVIP